MNSNQRSEVNNQSNNGGNEKDVSSSRGGTVEKDNLNQSQQSGTLGSGQKQGEQQQRQGQTGVEQQSTDRTGSQTGNQQQGGPAVHQSNDLAGGYPRSPGGANQLAADEDMDEDTGLSNRANRQSAEPDQGNRQMQQSNVGRRDDGTPD